MPRNFEEGDVIINIETLAYWDNPYHYEKTHKQMVPRKVVVANDKYFSAHGVLPEKLERLDSYSEDHVKRYAYCQKDGVQYDDYFRKSDRYLNLTKNKDGVLAYLNKIFDARFAKCDADDAEELAKIESMIEQLQARKQAVLAGKRTVSYNTNLVEREFLENNRATIMKSINEVL